MQAIRLPNYRHGVKRGEAIIVVVKQGEHCRDRTIAVISDLIYIP
jgi:hypothetical protein